MKKIATIIVIILLAVGSVFALHESQMTRNVDGKIMSVENGIVEINALGQSWEWELEEGEHFTEGQEVKIDFYDCGLDNFEVWEIVNIKG